MKKKVTKVIRILLWILIIVASIYMGYGIYRESRLRNYEEGSLIELPTNEEQNEVVNEVENTAGDNTENEVQNETANETTTHQNQNNNEDKTSDEIPATYKGYKVAGKLKIAKINIDTYVLANYSTEAMNVCVTKYYGSNPNEVGNCCIAGHNYLRKNMFGRLNQLDVGDEIILTDKKHGSIKYEIYDMFKVTPKQTSVLSQDTNGKKEITLITCSDYLKKRIIVKAREKT